MDELVFVLQITQDDDVDWIACFANADVAEESGARYALAQAEDILSRDEGARELVDEIRGHVERAEYSAAFEAWNASGGDGSRYVEVFAQPVASQLAYPGAT